MSLAMLGGQLVRTRPFPLWPHYDEQEEAELLRVLRGRSWGGYDSSVEELERSFAELHMVPHAVSCVNGTVALEVALGAAGVGPGDEVIVSPFTFVASATAILLCQGAPVFPDIDPQTLNLLPAASEAAITPKTRAIVVVHFGGHPADMDAFRELARRYKLAIIEDSAHAHGARWRNVRVGGWGDAGIFSFQAFKLMTAGEGGMIVTGSPEMADFSWSYCNQGRRRNGGWFEHVRLGTNYRMTGFQAAVLRSSCVGSDGKQKSGVKMLRTSARGCVVVSGEGCPASGVHALWSRVPHRTRWVTIKRFNHRWQYACGEGRGGC
jgi:dTDP-4-amino-4,6-dideoxygalactose transaminase